jgi:hypothetical protein
MKALGCTPWEAVMPDIKEPKRPAEDRKPIPKPPGLDPKDKPTRDTREDPAPNPDENAAESRPKKRP